MPQRNIPKEKLAYATDLQKAVGLEPKGMAKEVLPIPNEPRLSVKVITASRSLSSTRWPTISTSGRCQRTTCTKARRSPG